VNDKSIDEIFVTTNDVSALERKFSNNTRILESLDYEAFMHLVKT